MAWGPKTTNTPQQLQEAAGAPVCQSTAYRVPLTHCFSVRVCFLSLLSSQTHPQASRAVDDRCQGVSTRVGLHTMSLGPTAAARPQYPCVPRGGLAGVSVVERLCTGRKRLMEYAAVLKARGNRLTGSWHAPSL